MKEGLDQLLTQVIGVVAIIAWVSVTASLLFFTLKKTIGLRVSEEEELAGLDVLEHGSPGYGEGFGAFTVPAEVSNGVAAPVEVH